MPVLIFAAWGAHPAGQSFTQPDRMHGADRTTLATRLPDAATSRCMFAHSLSAVPLSCPVLAARTPAKRSDRHPEGKISATTFLHLLYPFDCSTSFAASGWESIPKKHGRWGEPCLCWTCPTCWSSAVQIDVWFVLRHLGSHWLPCLTFLPNSSSLRAMDCHSSRLLYLPLKGGENCSSTTKPGSAT